MNHLLYSPQLHRNTIIKIHFQVLCVAVVACTSQTVQYTFFFALMHSWIQLTDWFCLAKSSSGWLGCSFWDVHNLLGFDGALVFSLGLLYCYVN